MKLNNEVSGPKGGGKILLKDRDYRLLRIMTEHQLLSMDQIRNYFFSGRSDTPAYRRIQKLMSNGLVRKLSNYADTGSALFATTSLGRAHGLRGCHYNIATFAKPKPNELNHTLNLTDCRFLLQKLWPGIFYPESTIGEHRWKHKPDGVFQFVNNQLLPIELERANKGYTRLKAILELWEETKEIKNVLYIAVNEEIKRVILNTAAHRTPQHKLLVTTLEMLESDEPLGETISGPVPLKSLAVSDES